MRKVCVNSEDRSRSAAVLSRSCLRPSGHIVSLAVDDAIGVVLAVMPLAVANVSLLPRSLGCPVNGRGRLAGTSEAIHCLARIAFHQLL